MSSKISLIIQREYLQRVRKKSFIITTILMPLLFVGIVFIPVLIAKYSSEEQRNIVVIDKSGVIAQKLTASDAVRFTPTTMDYKEAEKEIEDAYGFLLINQNVVENPTIQLNTKKASTMTIEGEITRQIEDIIESIRIENTQISELDSIMRSVRAHVTLNTFTIDTKGTGEIKSSSSTISLFVGYAGGLLIYMFVFLYGAQVMQGIIEEKSNRIIEVVVSSVKPFQLMMGKILGIAFVALTQILIWIVLFILFSLLAGGLFGGGAEMSPETMGMAQMEGMPTGFASALETLSDPWYMFQILGLYILFFVGGYLLYASMFAAVGSAVDDVQDTQQLQLPITIPMIIALMVLITAMKTPDTGVAFWCSIIPFTSPIVMMARIPYGVPAEEIILSLVLLYGTFVAMTWMAAKIYRIGIFMYGKKPTLKEVIKWTKYKY